MTSETSVVLREQARKFEEMLGEDCQHSSEYGRCQECSIELFVEAMLAALKEAEKAICHWCELKHERVIEHGYFVHYRPEDGVRFDCDAAAIASLRSQLTEEKP